MGDSYSGGLAEALADPNYLLLIGNGINRFMDPGNSVTWQQLIVALAGERKIKLPDLYMTEGNESDLSLPEVADILRLEDNSPALLRQSVKNFIEANTVRDYSSLGIIRAAHENKLPILTTNFDTGLANNQNSTRAKIRLVRTHPKRKHLVPSGWNAYFGEKSNEEFARNIPALWHAHGSIMQPSTLKLTSAQYNRSIVSASNLIKHGLYANGTCQVLSCKGCEQCKWSGQGTWLDAFFHKKLLVIGLALKQDESFLRYLLIERAKYLRHHLGREVASKSGLFLQAKENSDPTTSSQIFFLEKLGIQTLQVETFDEIYDPIISPKKERSRNV